MSPSFARLSHFVFELFFIHKIPLTFAFIVIQVHSIKKSCNQSRNSDICEEFNGLAFIHSITFSNDKGLV